MGRQSENRATGHRRAQGGRSHMLCWITEERAVSQDDWIAGLPARGCPEGSAKSVGLNCEAERMKFGAVRDENSPSALMIAHDDHDSALSAAPKPRHHLRGFFKKIIEYQNDNEHRGMMHNHPSGDPTWFGLPKVCSQSV